MRRKSGVRDLSSGGHTEIDATMRPLSIVVSDVLPKNSIEMARLTMSSQSRHSFRTVLTRRSA
jgi:hypothetical protein